MRTIDVCRPRGRRCPAPPGGAARLLLAGAALVAGLVLATGPARAADRSVPGTRCLYEAINPVTPRLSLACSETDLGTWLASRGFGLSSLVPVPAVQADGSLEQGVFAAPGGDRVLLARYVSDRFFAPPPRSGDETRAAYLASLGITAQAVDAPGAFIPADDQCLGEFAVSGVATTARSGDIRLFRHCAPDPGGPYRGLRIVYIEGHSSFFDYGGIDFIRWLADLGFEVFVAEMPLFGFNARPAPATPATHDDFIDLEREPVSPLWTDFAAPYSAIYRFVREGASGSVGLAGRSGGGMLAYSVGLAQPLVDFVISIAGGTPQSMRLAAPAASGEVGDWEQWSPRTYREVGHEELMRHAGRLGGLFVYGGLDECCFRVLPGDGFHEWMSQPTGDGRIVQVHSDPENDRHGLAESGKPVVTAFLDRVLAAPRLSVVLDAAGGGRVTTAPGGVDCGTICTTAFVPGQVVDLLAEAAPGHVFAGWGGACAGTGACRVTMDGARQVTARFEPARVVLDLTVSGNGSGAVASDPPGIDCAVSCASGFVEGTPVSLTASPAPGSFFAGWGGACAGDGPCLVTMDAPRQVTATFSLSSFTLAVSRFGDGAGTVTSSAAGVDCGATCTASYLAGTTITLTATAAAQSRFVGWGGDCAGSGPCVVAMDSAKRVTATFSLDSGIPRLRNISTRLQVLPGNDALIGGFVIGGAQPKTVLVRARGPSLAPLGIANALANPQLQLFSGQALIGFNDDWERSVDAATVQSLGLAPSDARESAVLARLDPGPYTAIVSAVGDATGVGIVEVFEVDAPASALVNISTRGRSSSGENALIGGFVIQGEAPVTVIVRARGPSLAALGVEGTLVNPTLMLFAGQDFLASNEDWGDSPDASRIRDLGFAPANPYEAAILVTLTPGAYTAIVSDALGRPGVGIVEVFVP